MFRAFVLSLHCLLLFPLLLHLLRKLRVLQHLFSVRIDFVVALDRRLLL